MQGRKMCCSCLAFDAKQHHKYVVVSKGPNMVWFFQPDNLEYFVQTYTIWSARRRLPVHWRHIAVYAQENSEELDGSRRIFFVKGILGCLCSVPQKGRFCCRSMWIKLHYWQSHLMVRVKMVFRTRISPGLMAIPTPWCWDCCPAPTW